MLLEESIQPTKNKPNYLVVDDLISPNPTYRKRFLNKIGVPQENVFFSSNYQEANQQIKNISNIILCFIDCIIPEQEKEINVLEKLVKENEQERGDIVNNLRFAEWGIKLITENHHLDVCTFSAHLDMNDLKRLSEKYSNVVAIAEKPLTSKNLKVVKRKYIEPYFSEIITTQTSSGLSVKKKKFFDYSSLDRDLSSYIQERTQIIHKLLKRNLKDIIDIGNYLIDIQEKLGYGNFYGWLDAEFEWSFATAARYMSVAKRLGSLNVRELDDLAIAPTAMYELTYSTVPDECLEEALTRARAGETITRQAAKSLRTKYTKSKKKNSEDTKSLPEKKTGVNKNEDSVTQAEDKSETKTRQDLSSVNPKINQPQQIILKIESGQKAVSNTWWQLGEHHRLFCGQPTSEQFLNKLPSKIGLTINMPPNNDSSLIPSLKSASELSFRSESTELKVHKLERMVTDSIHQTTKLKETVVFCYLLYLELLEVAVEMDRCCIVAEPDLDKCDRLISSWRQKDPKSVKRFNP